MEKTRRSFLNNAIGVALCGGTGIAGLLGAGSSYAASAETLALKGSSNDLEAKELQWKGVTGGQKRRRLRMVNVHTNEKISVVYRNGNDYVGDALKQINFLLRDYRANEVFQIDAHTIDYLYKIYAMMGSEEYIQILSGYRSPATNEMLRKRSARVAKNSLHMVGKAIDFRIPGRKTKALQIAALDLKLGGIGYYEKSDFVHIDSGSFRHWQDKTR